MGGMYSHGNMVPLDMSRAEEWYLKATYQGDTGAQNNLGFLYQGNGAPQDCPKAFEWYLKAANQNHAAAQYNLGFMFERGMGVLQTTSEAMK